MSTFKICSLRDPHRHTIVLLSAVRREAPGAEMPAGPTGCQDSTTGETGAGGGVPSRGQPCPQVGARQVAGTETLEDQPSAHPGEPGRRAPWQLSGEASAARCPPPPTVGLSFLKRAFAVSFFSPATHCPFCP